MKIRVTNPTSPYFGRVFEAVSYDANDSKNYLRTFNKAEDGEFDENPQAVIVLTCFDTCDLEVVN